MSEIKKTNENNSATKARDSFVNLSKMFKYKE